MFSGLIVCKRWYIINSSFTLIKFRSYWSNAIQFFGTSRRNETGQSITSARYATSTKDGRYATVSDGFSASRHFPVHKFTQRTASTWAISYLSISVVTTAATKLDTKYSFIAKSC